MPTKQAFLNEEKLFFVKACFVFWHSRISDLAYLRISILAYSRVSIRK